MKEKRGIRMEERKGWNKTKADTSPRNPRSLILPWRSAFPRSYLKIIVFIET